MSHSSVFLKIAAGIGPDFALPPQSPFGRGFPLPPVSQEGGSVALPEVSEVILNTSSSYKMVGKACSLFMK